MHYAAPDGTTEIVLKVRGDADRGSDWFAKNPWLHQKERPDRLIAQLPFTPFTASCTEEEDALWGDRVPANGPEDQSKSPGDLDDVMLFEGSPFLWRPPLRVAILRQHRGSTFGEGYFALDLNTGTLHEIVPTGGTVIAVEGVRGFFCINGERYLPMGDGKKQVDCSFLDLWNAKLQKTRFCAPKVAQFYGGCLYFDNPTGEDVAFFP